MRSSRIRFVRAAMLVALFPAAARGATKTVTFEHYQKLDAAARRKLIRRYVRRTNDYWEVQLASYLVHTDISDEKALALAVMMDEFHRGFTKIFVGPFRIKARPELFALKDASNYQSAVRIWSEGRIAVPGWSAGIFAYVGRRYALFGCAKWGDEKLHSTLFHEGTHHLLHFYIGVDFPRWFDEGVATNFQDWDVAFSSERNVYEEMWHSQYPRYLYGMATGKNPRIKAKKPDLITLMSSTDADWLQSADPLPLYAQAWGFVNFLISSGGVGQKNFNVLIGAFKRGQNPRKVLPSHIRRALASQYDTYISKVIVPHCEFGIPIAKLIEAGRGSDAEKLLAKALAEHPKNNEFLFFKGLFALEAEKAKEAYATLKPLEKRFPRHPLLMRTLGKAALACGERYKAIKWLKKAVGEDFRDEEAKSLLEKAKKPRAR